MPLRVRIDLVAQDLANALFDAGWTLYRAGRPVPRDDLVALLAARLLDDLAVLQVLLEEREA